MDEAPPPPDYAYYEYMIWIKALLWLHLLWIYDMDEAPIPWLCINWIYDIDEAPLPPDYAYSEYMIWMKPPSHPDYAYYE